MGVCQSVQVRESAARNQRIERQMRRDGDALKKTVKLLLLGTAESGKSTVLKQMRILHSNGFSQADMQRQRSVVYGNVVQSMAAILRAKAEMDIPYDDADREVCARLIEDVVKAGKDYDQFTAEVYGALKSLWSDSGVQKTFARRNEYQLNDSAKFFLDALERIHDDDFTPTLQDILYARETTTGIIEVKFALKRVEFRVFDVGGQRSERKKWIHCFDDVNAVIFITALSEFNQTLLEDRFTNRMSESLMLFDSICNAVWFHNTSMILFLNKKDLFAAKLTANASIRTAFPEYNGPDTYASSPPNVVAGPNTYDKSAEYIEERFASVNKSQQRTIYRHQTCATDTNQLQLVMDSAVDTILRRNIQDLGLNRK